MTFFKSIFFMAFIQFAILGTLGEIVALKLSKKKIIVLKTVYSAIVWGVLGIIIKFVFVGFNGFVNELVSYGYLPSGDFWKAFFKSLFMNSMFGPVMVVIHRFLENLYNLKLKISKEGLKKAFWALLWFWLPAHTITFMLPNNWQITLAAVWSFVLGLLLSFFNTMKKESD
ncbi:hypothetical protein [Oceanotoga teriensis]|uniref:Mpv17/PMP22 family protein n=1 Tax=Oceanotoga teriensis TaxID=515440 RepID=A0AA45C997_9BACT|nr:hypothetical protein [Oceanotoga teriensis]MDO7977182.1 hypothetical protein [Oceanotoga teriensis]PWJ96547.1 hypothetical protein C7380_101120 [Oceanotoga teriensis]